MNRPSYSFQLISLRRGRSPSLSAASKLVLMEGSASRIVGDRALISGTGWAPAIPEIASNRDVDVTSQVPRDAEHAAFIEPLILLSPSMF